MKGGSHSRILGMWRSSGTGFTVVEVMVVLAVTGALFVSAAILIAGRQSQTEFNQGIQQIQSQMQLIMNEISSGYYPNLGNFQCQRSGSGIAINPGAKSQGTNSDCIFLGKVIQFGSGVVSGVPEKFATHSLAGLRTDVNGKDIIIFKDTSPTVIPGASTVAPLAGAVTVSGMWYNNKMRPIAAVAIVSSLGQASSTGLLAGSQKLNVIPIDGTTLTQDQGSIIAAVNAFLKTASPTVNPPNGVQVCFASGGTNQSGSLTLGSSGTGGRELEVTMDIKAGRSC